MLLPGDAGDLVSTPPAWSRAGRSSARPPCSPTCPASPSASTAPATSPSVAHEDLPDEGPDAITWRIGIEDPTDLTRTAEVVTLTRGAVATSGTAARGAHLYDPAGRRMVGRPGSTSVHGPSLLWADIWATALFVGGAAATRRVRVARAGVHQHRALLSPPRTTNRTAPRRWAGCRSFGGAEGTRTPDPLHAMQVRYQLRHSPIVIRHIAVLRTTTGILAGGSAGREIGSAQRSCETTSAGSSIDGQSRHRRSSA